MNELHGSHKDKSFRSAFSAISVVKFLSSDAPRLPRREAMVAQLFAARPILPVHIAQRIELVDHHPAVLAQGLLGHVLCHRLAQKEIVIAHLLDADHAALDADGTLGDQRRADDLSGQGGQAERGELVRPFRSGRRPPASRRLAD